MLGTLDARNTGNLRPGHLENLLSFAVLPGWYHRRTRHNRNYFRRAEWVFSGFPVDGWHPDREVAADRYRNPHRHAQLQAAPWFSRADCARCRRA